ncbi:MAG TPA: nucleotidyl transferase AbiEii/AbiGii toxin family protein [Thermoanaerobaculia bacterium]|nr:nucleotidyl transferase AbiEii/AbiGii toxin family protein [Thermoanaerobaculia bacterium]
MAALSPAHPESLPAEARSLLARMAPLSWAEDFYVAGSAALALYVGHRPVRDVDLMTNANRLTSPERRDLLGALLALDPGVEVETARDGYLYVRFPGEVGFRFFYYPYPLVQPFEDFEGFAVASAVDLGLMKLGAIISRGTRRDFVDLYLLCRQLPLADLLHASEDKFGHVRDFPLQALKGLADLSEVEGEPMPRLAQPLDWEEVEAWLRTEVRELGRARVGLGSQA